MNIYEHMLSFVLSKYLRVEWLYHKVSVYLTLYETIFFKWLTILNFHQKYVKVHIAPHPKYGQTLFNFSHSSRDGI